MHDDEPLASGTIELADTRPAMLWLPWLGEVPVQAAALLIMGFGSVVMIAGDNIWWLPAFPAWWAVGRACALDYHFFTRLSHWLATSAWCRDAGVQGGSSAAPWPLRPSSSTLLLASLGLRRIQPRGM